MKRIEIILSICSGMQYLELDCESCIADRSANEIDFNSANETYS